MQTGRRQTGRRQTDRQKRDKQSGRNDTNLGGKTDRQTQEKDDNQ